MSALAVWLSACGVGSVLIGLALSALHRRRSPDRLDRMGPYELVALIGEGGMGRVYEARHAALGRPTALKVVKIDPKDPRRAARFAREARLTAELRHVNAVTLYDCGRDASGSAFIALELVDGVSLDKLLRARGALPPAQVHDILVQLARALEHVHDRAIVHRDVKPSNVMVAERGDGTVDVKLIDFGLATRISEDERARGRTSIVGTPLYMAPESSDPSADVGPEVDVYGAGMIGWALLTGTALFADHATRSLPDAHRREPPLPPSLKTATDVPPDLERVILACLEKDPAARFADGRALREALEGCAAHPLDTPPMRPPARSAPRLRADVADRADEHAVTRAFPLLRRRGA